MPSDAGPQFDCDQTVESNWERWGMPSHSLLSLIQPALFDAVGTPAYLIGGGGGMTRVGVAVTVGLAVGARVGVGSTKVAGSSLAGTAVGTRVAVGDPKHRM